MWIPMLRRIRADDFIRLKFTISSFLLLDYDNSSVWSDEF